MTGKKSSQKIQGCYLINFLGGLGILDPQDLSKFYAFQKSNKMMSPIEWCVSEGGIPPQKLCFLFEHWFAYKVFELKNQEHNILRAIDIPSHGCSCFSVGAVFLKDTKDREIMLIACPFMKNCIALDSKELSIYVASLDQIQRFLSIHKNSEFYQRTFNPEREIKMLHELLKERIRKEAITEKQLSKMVVKLNKYKTLYLDLIKKPNELQEIIDIQVVKIEEENSELSKKLLEFESKNPYPLDVNKNLFNDSEKWNNNNYELNISLFEAKSKINELEITLESKMSEIKTKDELIRGLEKNLEHLHYRLEDYEKIKGDLETSSKMLCKLESERDSLRDRVEEKEKGTQHFRELAEELQKKLQEMQNRTDMLEKEVQDKNIQKAKEESEELERLQKQVDELNKEILILISHKDQLSQENNDFKLRILELEGERKILDRKILAREYIKKVDSPDQAIEFLIALLELDRIMNVLDNGSQQKINKIIVAREALKQGKLEEAIELVKQL